MSAGVTFGVGFGAVVVVLTAAGAIALAAGSWTPVLVGLVIAVGLCALTVVAEAARAMHVRARRP